MTSTSVAGTDSLRTVPLINATTASARMAAQPPRDSTRSALVRPGFSLSASSIIVSASARIATSARSASWFGIRNVTTVVSSPSAWLRSERVRQADAAPCQRRAPCGTTGQSSPAARRWQRPQDLRAQDLTLALRPASALALLNMTSDPKRIVLRSPAVPAARPRPGPCLVLSLVTCHIATTTIAPAPSNPTRPNPLERTIRQAIPTTGLLQPPDAQRVLSGSVRALRVAPSRRLSGWLHKPRSHRV